MRKGIQKSCALLLGTIWAVTGAVQPLGMLAFAEESGAANSSVIASSEEFPAQNEVDTVEKPEDGLDAESAPENAAAAEQTDAMQENEATKENSPSAPTSQAQETESVPTSVPQENFAPTLAEEEEMLTFAQLQEQVEALLEKSWDMTQLSEEELGQLAEEMEQVASVPVTLDNEENQEIQELMEQLANAKVSVENMQLAYQAQREGWLDKIPQTGLENSWRYQNGQRIETEELEEDLPDGVSFFSAGGYRGIDVSHHQGVIDWEAVKNAGIDFAMIRCGYGNDQTDQDDKQWERNASECERLGIPYGVYFYSYALTADMAVSEGQHAVRLLQGHTPDLPVFFDMEENSQLVLGSSGLAEIARIFTDIVSAQGYEVGVYASLNWWNHYLTDPVFENWYRWVAEWRSSCSYGGRYEMWQYTSDGSVSGINGRVDMDYWYGELWEEADGYSAIYDYNFYISHNPDLAQYTQEQAFQHFVEHGMEEGRQGNAEFNVYNYRARYADLMDWLDNDLRSYYIHYKDHGKAEGRDASSYCRLTRYKGQDYSVVYGYDYYIQNNEDIRNLYGYNDYLTIQHFVEHGMEEGRQGSAEFNAFIYRERYKDLLALWGNDMRQYYYHYKDYGKAEGRIAV